LAFVLLTIWAFGALIVAARFARGWWKVYAAKRAARPLELAADVPVFGSQVMIEPGVFGFFRPVLLLPERILERLSPEQLSTIVAHEMCHVRRRDNLTYLAHTVAEVLFWFYPPVWWIGKCLIEERERACDEAVVDAGGKPHTYAEGILNVSAGMRCRSDRFRSEEADHANYAAARDAQIEPGQENTVGRCGFRRTHGPARSRVGLHGPESRANWRHKHKALLLRSCSHPPGPA
jgi:hypothetical protein